MAHQAHNIPWNAVAEALHRPPGCKDGPLGLDLRNKDTPEQRRLAHFSRKFAATLKEFVTTRKAVIRPASGTTGISTEELCILRAYVDKHNRIGPALHDDLCRTSHWLEPVSYADPRAEVVMLLVATRQLDALSRLSRLVSMDDPSASTLCRLHRFPMADPGWGRVRHSAMATYIYLNAMYCLPHNIQLSAQAHRWENVLQLAVRQQDGDTYTIPHREFLCRADGTRSKPDSNPFEGTPEALVRLREYLTQSWESIVVAAVVVDLAGVEVDWADEVMGVLWHLWRR